MIFDMEEQCFKEALDYPHLLVSPAKDSKPLHCFNYSAIETTFFSERIWPRELAPTHGQEVSQENQQTLAITFPGCPTRRER